MSKLKIKVFILFVYCTIIKAEPIRGGKEVESSDKYPFVASLRYVTGKNPPEHFCGGSIIDKRHILTASHCLLQLHPKDVIVAVGTTETLAVTDSNKYSIYSWIMHKDFVKTAYEHNYVHVSAIKDIALIRVSRDIDFSDTVKPIPLDEVGSTNIDDEVEIVGFGFSGFNCTDETKHLNYLKSTIAYSSYNHNDPTYNPEDKLTICFFCREKDKHMNDDTKFFTFCKGDSGGPVISYKTGQAVLVGVMSTFGDYYQHAVKVHSFLDEIEDMKQELVNF